MSLRDFRRRFFFHARRDPLRLMAHVWMFGDYYCLSYHVNAVPLGGSWYEGLYLYRSPNATAGDATGWLFGEGRYRRINPA